MPKSLSRRCTHEVLFHLVYTLIYYFSLNNIGSLNPKTQREPKNHVQYVIPINLQVNAIKFCNPTSEIIIKNYKSMLF